MKTEANFENEIAKITWQIREKTDENWYEKPLYLIRVEPKNWKSYSYTIETHFSKDARKIFINEVIKILM